MWQSEMSIPACWIALVYEVNHGPICFQVFALPHTRALSIWSQLDCLYIHVANSTKFEESAGGAPTDFRSRPGNDTQCSESTGKNLMLCHTYLQRGGKIHSSHVPGKKGRIDLVDNYQHSLPGESPQKIQISGIQSPTVQLKRCTQS